MMLQDQHEQQDNRCQQAINILIQRIKQEQLNPSLTSFDQQTVQFLKDTIKQQKSKLKDFLNYSGQEDNNNSNRNFRYMIYEAQIDKFQYLLKMYLKIRLKKIQTYCFYLIKNQVEAEKLLSSSQKIFLRKYGELRYQYYKDNVFRFLVKNYRDFKGVQIILAKPQEDVRQRRLLVQTKQSKIQLVSPDLKKYVFAQILNNSNQLRFGIDIKGFKNGEQSMDVVPQGKILFCPFQTISDKFNPSQYRLI